jgi:hypothetical protein
MHQPGGVLPIFGRQRLVESLDVCALVEHSRADSGGRHRVGRRGVDDSQRLPCTGAGTEGDVLQIAQTAAELHREVFIEGNAGVLRKLLGGFDERCRLEGAQARLPESHIAQRVSGLFCRPDRRRIGAARRQEHGLAGFGLQLE